MAVAAWWGCVVCRALVIVDQEVCRFDGLGFDRKRKGCCRWEKSLKLKVVRRLQWGGWWQWRACFRYRWEISACNDRDAVPTLRALKPTRYRKRRLSPNWEEIWVRLNTNHHSLHLGWATLFNIPAVKDGLQRHRRLGINFPFWTNGFELVGEAFIKPRWA